MRLQLQNNKGNKGNIVIALLFVMFLTFLGLSLLGFSIFHTWIRNGRAQKITETDRMHQELIYYLHSFREKIFNQDLRPFLNPEVDYFNNSNFPDITTSIGNNENVIIKNSFTNLVFPRDFYTKTRIIDNINVSSSKTNYSVKSEVFVDMVSGQIPLTFFPFFLDIAGETTGNENLLLQNVNVNGMDMEGGSSPNMTLNDVEVEFNSTEFLMNCLEIQGTALTWAAMREKFGFEVSNEPIPEGIHMLVEDNLVKCIFIQGNVDRLVFSVVDNIQVFRVVKQGVSHEYQYKPGENYFIDRDNLSQEAWLFKERIIVNGDIWSLEQEGDAAFTDKAKITLFASGKVNIHSDLKSKSTNLTLQKILSTSLSLVCASGTLFDREDLKPGVTVEPMNGKDEISIQVSIITNGKLTNKSPKLKVNGSIYSTDLENQGDIDVNYMEAGSDWGAFFRAMDFKYIYHFHINSIEETEETP